MTAVLALQEQLDAQRRRILAPPPKLTVSEWADLNRVVSNYSAEPGPWRTDRTPYLREIMDCGNDPGVEIVVFMKCTRIGATEAGLNIVGYFIDQDPSPILIVQPTVDDAKDFSKEQLAPMLEDTECLASKVSDPRSRDSKNTVQAKVFKGGGLYLVGANSPRGFRRRTCRVLPLEEVDAWPASAGKEGDQVKLAMRRATTFQRRRKVYMNSSPTLKGMSRIEEWFNRSDQRRYQVPCPHCNQEQPLVWKQLRYSDLPEPMYECVNCKELIAESEKHGIVATGRWVPTHPGRPIRGYHMNALYSPWISWKEMVEEWQEAQGDQGKLQVFVNTLLGEVWEERAGGLGPGWQDERKEAYPAGCEIPNGVGYLTLGVDVQDDRLEYVLRGWGAGYESWLIDFGRILGDTSRKFGLEFSPWNEVEKIRTRAWTMESGRTIRIFATSIDTGGHSTDAAYGYCGPRYTQRVYATKGSSTPGSPLLPRKPTRNNKARIPLFLVGSEAAKDVVYSNLRVSQPGPNYMHIPDPIPTDWSVQVVAEHKVRKQMPGGKWVSRYVLPIGARSEALDCEAQCLIALRLTPLRPAEIAKMAEALAIPPEKVEPKHEEQAEAPRPKSPPPPRSSIPRRGGTLLRGLR